MDGASGRQNSYTWLVKLLKTLCDFHVQRSQAGVKILERFPRLGGLGWSVNARVRDSLPLVSPFFSSKQPTKAGTRIKNVFQDQTTASQQNKYPAPQKEAAVRKLVEEWADSKLVSGKLEEGQVSMTSARCPQCETHMRKPFRSWLKMLIEHRSCMKVIIPEVWWRSCNQFVHSCRYHDESTVSESQMRMNLVIMFGTNPFVFSMATAHRSYDDGIERKDSNSMLKVKGMCVCFTFTQAYILTVSLRLKALLRQKVIDLLPCSRAIVFNIAYQGLPGHYSSVDIRLFS